MLTPAQAARLIPANAVGIDDPTEVASIRWYWDRTTGCLMRAGWRSLFPICFPEYTRPQKTLTANGSLQHGG